MYEISERFGLNWSGGIENLLPHDLLIVDETGKTRWYYPAQFLPAKITWYGHDTCDGAETERTQVNEHYVEVPGEFEVVGSMNDVIDLVKPKSLTWMHGLINFWERAIKEQSAHTEDLPDMKKLRKSRRSAPKSYCVVSRGVAILAHYEYQELGRLLVPAMSVELPNGEFGYRALMPAQFLFSEVAQSY